MAIDTILGQAQDVDEKLFPYYLYRHIRKDNGQVFYVGIGNNNCYLAKKRIQYYRAYDKSNRNRHWNAIVKKTSYEVELVIESSSKEFIIEKEIEFIKLYGRRDRKAGTLCNLTDGGEGVFGMSDETKAKVKATIIKNGTKLGFARWENPNKVIKEGDPAHYSEVERYVYNAYTRELIGKFRNGRICSNAIGVQVNHLSAMASKKISAKGYIISNTELKTPQDFDQFKIGEIKKHFTYEVTNNTTSETKTYKGAKEAIKATGISRYVFYDRCRNGGGVVNNYQIKILE